MGKYFSIEELCRSNTADAKGIKNIPNDEQKRNLEALINKVLDPLREAYGKPIIVSSGFRNVELNKEVGGVPTSQHQKGEAADLDVGSVEENKKLFELIQKLNLPFDQLIDEKKMSWIHVSYSSTKQRKQVLKL
jgi:zinc D-Ala-D-Ala carboxypeptidase